MRLYKVGVAEAEEVVQAGSVVRHDRKGNVVIAGLVHGRVIEVVVDLEEPTTVVTLHPRRN